MSPLPDLPDRTDWREDPQPQGKTGRVAFVAVLGVLALVFVGTLWALQVDLLANAPLVVLGTLAFLFGVSRAFYLLRDRREERSKPFELRVIEVVDAEHSALPFTEGRSILGSARSRAPTAQEDGTWRVYNLSDGGHA